MGLVLRQTAIYNGITPSEKNKEFVTARFTVPESYKGNILNASNLNKPNIVVPFNFVRNAKIMESLNALSIGGNCILDLDTSVEQANGAYGAKVKFDLLNISTLPVK
jgi:hypothetical protein